MASNSMSQPSAGFKLTNIPTRPSSTITLTRPVLLSQNSRVVDSLNYRFNICISFKSYPACKEPTEGRLEHHHLIQINPELRPLLLDKCREVLQENQSVEYRKELDWRTRLHRQAVGTTPTQTENKAAPKLYLFPAEASNYFQNAAGTLPSPFSNPTESATQIQLSNIQLFHSRVFRISITAEKGSNDILYFARNNQEFFQFCQQEVIRISADIAANSFARRVMKYLIANSIDFCRELAAVFQARHDAFYYVPKAIPLLTKLLEKLGPDHPLDFISQYLKVNLPDPTYQQTRKMLVSILEEAHPLRIERLAQLVVNNIKWIVDKPLGCLTISAMIREGNRLVIESFEKLLEEYPVQTFVRKYRRVCLLNLIDSQTGQTQALSLLFSEIKKKVSNLSYVLKKRESMLLYLLIISVQTFMDASDREDLLKKIEKIRESKSNFIPDDPIPGVLELILLITCGAAAAPCPNIRELIDSL